MILISLSVKSCEILNKFAVFKYKCWISPKKTLVYWVNLIMVRWVESQLLILQRVTLVAPLQLQLGTLQRGISPGPRLPKYSAVRFRVFLTVDTVQIGIWAAPWVVPPGGASFQCAISAVVVIGSEAALIAIINWITYSGGTISPLMDVNKNQALKPWLGKLWLGKYFQRQFPMLDGLKRTV